MSFLKLDILDYWTWWELYDWWSCVLGYVFWLC